VTASDSVAIGGMVVRNDVRSDVDAFMDNTDLSAGGSVSVDANANAKIAATLLSVVSSSGGSAFGTGTSLAVNGTIATNVVQSSAVAKITNSEVGDSTTSIGGNVTVTADNTSGIDATALTATETGDTAVGVVLAFNTIGWESQNALFNTVDGLLGNANIGSEDPAEVIAAVENSTVDATGDLTVAADNQAKLNATVSNAPSSAASALFLAGGMSASAALSSNKVSTDTRAYVSAQSVVMVGGNVVVDADDQAGIYANSKIVSDSAVTNDGGASVIQETLNDFLNADHTSDETSVFLQFGDRVRLADSYEESLGNPGSVYEYLGITDFNPTTSLPNTTTDLSGVDYSNLGYWKEVPVTNLIPQGLNLTDSDSIGIAGLVVSNEVRSEVLATIHEATVDAVLDVKVDANNE
ncbi:MAG: hypothetical protein GY904_29090, partial [Planctomycetaceae bacterium]|nr:hypothetical protein [Planctomycetaceae bacterium]